MVEIPPIFVSVKKAAAMLDITPWSMYKLLDDGKVDSVYQGSRRNVVLSSLYEYAESLPSTRDAS